MTITTSIGQRKPTAVSILISRWLIRVKLHPIHVVRSIARCVHCSWIAQCLSHGNEMLDAAGNTLYKWCTALLHSAAVGNLSLCVKHVSMLHLAFLMCDNYPKQCPMMTTYSKSL
jgi:hypothetical protein